jgi:hypothetical protein
MQLQFEPSQAVKVAGLVAQFYRAIERQRARREEIRAIVREELEVCRMSRQTHQPEQRS